MKALFVTTILVIAAATVRLQADKKETAPLASGPQVGDKAPAYHPLFANGKSVGQRWCMVCTHRGRGNAMVIVFARERGPASEALAKAVETVVGKHDKVGGIVTFLTTEDKSADEAEALTGGEVRFLSLAEKTAFESLRAFAKSESITNCSLNLFTTDGPRGYEVAPDAAVTVLVADASTTVKKNIALRKDEFTVEQVDEIAAAIDKSLGSL